MQLRYVALNVILDTVLQVIAAVVNEPGDGNVTTTQYSLQVLREKWTACGIAVDMITVHILRLQQFIIHNFKFCTKQTTKVFHNERM
jgi:hypothetical protein